MIHRLILSAPFGNYLSFPQCTSTVGTFTREYRGGLWCRLWRVLRTVRYYPGVKAWKNKLGLPNPGIDWLKRYRHDNPDASGFTRLGVRIVSVSARNTDDWLYVIREAVGARPAAVELNVSCPNTGEADASDYRVVFGYAAARSVPVIVKLPPLGYESMADRAVDCGIRSFHCCNTLPVPGRGGLSGKPLKPLSLAAVARVVRSADSSGVPLDHLIGGGGVTCMADATDYLNAGATHVAVGSALFFPWNWPAVRAMGRKLAERR